VPNIATVLKDEIARLARKEVKVGTGALRKANSQYRRDIAKLKRQVDDLTKQVAYLERREKQRVNRAAPEELAEGRRFSARGLKVHRAKLGLSAADYAALVGVSAQTIYSWEHGQSKPRDAQLAALVSVRGLGKRDAQKRLELLQR
jgi:DNA-binding transcriptional regulator YiaG